MSDVDLISEFNRGEISEFRFKRVMLTLSDIRNVQDFNKLITFVNGLSRKTEVEVNFNKENEFSNSTDYQ